MTEWTNSDGLVVRFENPSSDGFTATTKTAGVKKQLIVDFDFDNIPTPASGDNRHAILPKGAGVLSAYFMTGTAWSGGTNLSVGFVEEDGTVIDSDGIFTTTELATANLTADKLIVGSAGADLGTVVSPTADGYLRVSVNGTYTAGTARVVVEYIDAGSV